MMVEFAPAFVKTFGFTNQVAQNLGHTICESKSSANQIALKQWSVKLL